jgi:peptidoglycan/xylan/chitin deacetylase (PgdA/CDA1 family)
VTPGRAALYVATAAGLALGVRAAYDPPPLSIALGAFVLYGGLVTTGVLVPRLEMFADVLWRGPDGSRGVALTFDDGPHPVHTRAILKKLDAAGVKATFFVIGQKVERHPDVVREIAARGHLVALHGDAHDRLLAFRTPETVRADLTRARDRLAALLGEPPVLYRPAVGQTNPRIARVADELGLAIVGWSVRARDGIATRADAVVRRVVPKLRDGAIVLLHDAAERDDREPAAVEALDRILDAMHARQLVAVRIDEWFPRRA